MTDETRLNYPAMVQQALRSVVSQALIEVSERGLPGDHHFYLRFRTEHPAVVMPGFLREQHPEEMTIILQHRFSGLMVDAESFAVSLSFGGAWHSLTVPFKALTAFSDPEANFMLQFLPEMPGEEGEAAGDEPGAEPGLTLATVAAAEVATDDDSGTDGRSDDGGSTDSDSGDEGSGDGGSGDRSSEQAPAELAAKGGDDHEAEAGETGEDGNVLDFDAFRKR